MEQQYLSHAANILTRGNVRPDRTNTGTRSIFGHLMRHNLQEGFPLLTSKFVSLRLIIEELVWILSGSTNIRPLLEKNCHIWDEWALKDRILYTPIERHALLLKKMENEGRPGHYGSLVKRSEDYGVNFKGCLVELHITCDAHGIPREKIGRKDGELGPVYGAQWRRWSGNKVFITDVEAHIAFGANAEDGMSDLQEMLKDAKEDNGIDQIAELIKGLKEKPYSRRHIVSGWNPDDMPDESKSHAENVSNDKQALPPCHTLFQFYVRDRDIGDLMDEYARRHGGKSASVDVLLKAAMLEVNYDKVKLREKFKGWGYKTQLLDCQLYQRSADWFLGVPFNIASYSLLTMMVAQCVGMLPGEFVHSFGDSHIYGNHIAVVEEQLKREVHPLPTVKINPAKTDIFSFTVEDFELIGYQHSGKLSGQVAV